MKSVFFYTSTNFLDAILETIQSIKEKTILHVFIEISNQSKHTTIIDVDKINHLKFIEKPENVLGEIKWNLIKEYFNGVASVQFIVYKRKRSLTLNTFILGYKLMMYTKKLKIDVFHFDTFSTRAIGLVPYIIHKKVVSTIHDPIPHSGENSWKENIPNWIFLKISNSILFYSAYAKKQFLSKYINYKKPISIISLQPYTINKKHIKNKNYKRKYITFFGRLSYYKGIDILLDAIPKVIEKYPDQLFLIIGKEYYKNVINHEIILKYKNNIEIHTNYMETSELIDYIQQSKFIVCPYRDATQSGVLMTSNALGKTTIATSVGSFPEYIINNTNGLIANPDSFSFADKIIEALENNKYLELEKNIISTNKKEVNKKNELTLLEVYA